MARKKKEKIDTSLVDFIEALEEINKTKGIDKEIIIEAVEAAMVMAYKKNSKTNEDVEVNIDRNTGQMRVFTIKEVVSEVTDEDKQISLEEARKTYEEIEEGDRIETDIEPKTFGRIATQNAKQLIIQKLKDAERTMISEEFLQKKDEMLTGFIQREEYKEVRTGINGVSERQVIIHVDLGRAEGIINHANQVKSESYYPGMRLKVYVSDVIVTPRGPQIILSRTHSGLVKRLFEEEVIEISEGIVEIKSIAREAGSRTKMAVFSLDPQVDPVGTCIGPKGFRIQNVLREIGDEKVDVIKWSKDPEEFIKNALSPASVLKIDILEEDGKQYARAIVEDSQLSLAIGKDGQNVRLAARVTGWKIDIKSKSEYDRMIKTGEIVENVNESTKVIDDNPILDDEILINEENDVINEEVIENDNIMTEDMDITKEESSEEDS